MALIAVTLVNACGGRSPSRPSPISSSPSPTAITRLELGAAGNASLVVFPGSTLQLWALATHGDGSKTDATNLAQWQTSNPAIATVSAGGVLTAVDQGSVTVSATYQESATVAATVRKPGCEDASLSPVSVTYNALDHGKSSYYDDYVTLNATIGCAWTVSGEVPWLGNLSRKASDSGMTSASRTALAYFVDANNSAVARTGRLRVSIGGRDLLFTVTQEAAH